MGHGTTFRIDPWRMCATAFHVVEDLVELNDASDNLQIRSDVRLVALDLPGLVYGSIPIVEQNWRPLEGLNSPLVGIETRPLQTPSVRNTAELAAIWVSPSSSSKSGTPYFSCSLRWKPTIGDTVMALGFAGLDIDSHGEGDDRPIEQRLYGSVGKILDVGRADANSSRPWPTIRVNADWPAGMSGGPVFNHEGHVVGIVSTGLMGQAIGTATFFSSWDVPERTFKTIDPDNPGWFFCFGVFDQDINLTWIGLNRVDAERFAIENDASDIRFLSFQHKAQEYITLRRFGPPDAAN